MKIFHLLAICLCFAWSCTTLYIPNRINVPELQKKGDLRMSASMGFDGTNLQAAYAVNSRIGILANYYTVEQREYQSNFLRGGGAGLEVGAGYFRAPKNYIFESYATIGYGSLYHRSQDFYTPGIINNLDASFWRLGLQSSASVRLDVLSLSAMLRINQMNYYNIQSPEDTPYINDGQRLRADNTHYFVEPGVQAALGYKNIRFNLQLQRSWHLGQSWFDDDKIHYSAGVQLAFNVFKKEKDR